MNCRPIMALGAAAATPAFAAGAPAATMPPELGALFAGMAQV